MGRRRSAFQSLLRRLIPAALVLTPTFVIAQFEGDIQRWTAQDGIAHPRPGAVLFVGSSSIRRWEQLALDFADYRVLQRGFGGAQFDDVIRYVNDIVLPYKPSAIVVWAGTNDLGAGDDGQEVFADYEEFVRTVHKAQPGVDIFYLGIMPTPGRYSNGPEETVANSAIASAAASDPKLHYIDLPTAFTALNPPDGAGFQEKFVDRIHLNRSGYDLWTSIIRPQIEAVIAPNKTFAPNPQTPGVGDRILFDFGPSNAEDGAPTVGPDANGNHWNNWHPAVGGDAVNAGERMTNLVDTKGDETGVSLTITGGFRSKGKADGGLLSPAHALLGGLAIETATADYFFSTADGVREGGNDDVPGGFMIGGLDPGRAYDLRLFGSRQSVTKQVTKYLVTGAKSHETLLLTSRARISKERTHDGNDSQLATVCGVHPDPFGQLFIDLTLAEGEGAYLNALELTSADPPSRSE